MSESKKIENKIPCEVVQDLLPLYVDGVTNKVTTDMVKEHMGECKECQGEYDVLCTEFPKEGGDDKTTKKRFDAMMKVLKRKRVRVSIVLVILTCLMCYFAKYLLYDATLKKIPPEDYKIQCVYKYDTDEGSKFFMIYQVRAYYGSGTGYNTDMVVDGDKATWVVEGRENILRPKASLEFREMNHQTMEAPEGCTALFYNGEAVWSEDENGKNEVPEFVYEYQKDEEALWKTGTGEGGLDTWVIDENGQYIGKTYGTGEEERQVLWDFDGNVIYEGKPLVNG